MESTLNSLNAEIQNFKRQFSQPPNFLQPSPQINIHIGMDHCTDRTEALTRNWARENATEISISYNSEAQGKWQMLGILIERSRARWVGLIDAGAIWTPGLLLEVFKHLNSPDVIGIAPSYSPMGSGFFESVFWRIEQLFKRIEGEAGGPVSVHGATVIYRRLHLKKVLNELKRKTSNPWLNDDVVIPLSLRMKWPHSKIVYLSENTTHAWVQDQKLPPENPAPKKVVYRRRRRMVLGNIQWIRALYWNAIWCDPRVALLASRRVFRTFWGTRRQKR